MTTAEPHGWRISSGMRPLKAFWISASSDLGARLMSFRITKLPYELLAISSSRPFTSPRMADRTLASPCLAQACMTRDAVCDMARSVMRPLTFSMIVSTVLALADSATSAGRIFSHIMVISWMVAKFGFIFIFFARTASFFSLLDSWPRGASVVSSRGRFPPTVLLLPAGAALPPLPPPPLAALAFLAAAAAALRAASTAALGGLPLPAALGPAILGRVARCRPWGSSCTSCCWWLVDQGC
mmetsp:Transcript_9411/g.23845  ORF Transcript_9411/g.23845 Transcript_9411/m.23845 type:complete len:241 (+) Transcript_9411:1453-2175(+)